MKAPVSLFLLLLLLVVFAISLVSQFHHFDLHHSLGFCGGNQPVLMASIDEIARFAVEEHNHKENAVVELGRVVKAEEQVVAGTLHHLTLEVMEGGSKKLYEAKVWVKPWMDNFKELQEFKYVGDAPSFTRSDLGAKRDGEYGFGVWKAVGVEDQNVQDAAEHAVKTIQQRSNSLIPYQLHQVLHANAQVSEGGCAKFDMVVKVRRGEKEEKLKVEVHKNEHGAFHLNKMEPDSSDSTSSSS